VKILILLALLATSPSQIVGKLNAQRAANGIPAGITLNTAWTTGCMHHVKYEEANGIPWTHEEVAGKPGFTKDGQLAGGAGDQSYTQGWELGNPFENLPLHLANLLAPSLQQIGAYQSGRRVCMEIALGNTRQFADNAIYTYPGNGRTGVATSQTVHGEWPHSPGDVVGLPQGTTTGPTIYVFSVGSWQFAGKLSLAASSLAGPRGPVSYRVVDPQLHAAIKPYVAAGVFFLMPVSPLAAHTSYSASVTVKAADGTTQTKTWKFTTGS
jgi:hypothetical protein